MAAIVLVAMAVGHVNVVRADPPAAPSTVKAEVLGIKNTRGKIGCALHSATRGFPTDPNAALKSMWNPIKYNSLTCEFPWLPPGNYAVACFTTRNNNGKLDTNLFGAPSEAVGSSNNVRHSFSAPTFDECKFAVKAGTVVTTKIPLVY
jgi:uncharacterized protein (DUF2141 family)